MKVGILSIASPYHGGIYQYTLSLLEALKSSCENHEYIQIRYPDFPEHLDKSIVINNQKSSIPLKLKRLIHIYTSFVLGDLVPNMSTKLSDIDLVISPIITLLPFHMKKPFIVTIHDFQQEYYPNFFTPREKILRKIIYRTGKYANIIVTESEYVKKDVIRFLGVTEEKIIVVPSPPPSYLTSVSLDDKKLKEIKEQYELPDKYVFYPAQFWYHKNHLKLLESLHLIKQKYGEKIPLILAGSKQNNFENVKRKIRELGMEEQVKYLGYIPDEDMPCLYNLATALVMPTLFESLSLPIWEAFYLGTPVISSNVCVLPEQVGDAGLLFDPYNIEDIAEKIYKMWIDESIRKELTQKGYQRVKNLTLENYAKQWEKIIEGALARAK